MVVIKGGGDLASGTAHRLARCGFTLVMLEIAQPTVIRRTVSYAEAIFKGKCSVEGVTAELAHGVDEVQAIVNAGNIAVAVDPAWSLVDKLKPAAVIDAVLAKKNLGTGIGEAPVVIGLGPGFTAGVDVHAVVETMRGHNLGRVILKGTAEPNTGIPGIIGGYGKERVLRAPAEGIFHGEKEIGDQVVKGELVAKIDDVPLVATIDGVLRGLLKSGLKVHEGMKVGDIDPRATRENCFTISDKSRAIAGGVLEALLYLGRDRWGVN
nr:selenium-dependent molybdenum cofactor biosynthesis protein YqeB [Desulfoscipio gibsoniae]